MAWTFYNAALEAQYDGNAINFDSGGDTIKVMVTTSSYTPNASTHDFKDDVTNEVSGTNYTAGGATLANQLISEAAGTVTFDGDDITWTQHASGFSDGRTLVMYEDTGVAGTSQLIAYHSEGSDFGNVSGDLTAEMNASGIFTVS